ncbi:MAG: cobalamin biosynthesis protein P47K [Planctomycetia bacterium]|nr:cobalamin biosynthesis protein P47K [Planctomycetia bacterium]
MSVVAPAVEPAIKSVVERVIEPRRPIRFLMLGGFLGAGKTTAIARLARHFQTQGKSVALITNDKASDLVDTLNLRAQGFHVGELPGICFCGNVGELIEMIRVLGVAGRPDVVIAEPVGSCLDMVATVLQPLRAAYGREFEVAPFGVLVKPTHAVKILRNEDNAGFSPKAAYIFRKQLEEADFVVVNRIDQLTPLQVAEITSLLHEQYPQLAVLAMSATTGAGFEHVATMFEQSDRNDKPAVPLDYTVYGAGEAELGWLNGSILVTAERAVPIDDLLLDVVRAIRERLRQLQAEVSHLKVIGIQGGKFAVANLISTAAEPELSQPGACELAALQLIINARVGCAPEELRQAVELGLRAAADAHRCSLEEIEMQCFRPGVATPG